MEHFQLPRNPIHPHIKVPYFCTDHYDGGPFLQYLDRTGWTTSQILDALQHQNLDRSKEDVQALLQTWFFFGLLTDVFGIQIEISDFVTLDQYMLEEALTYSSHISDLALAVNLGNPCSATTRIFSSDLVYSA